MRIIILAALVGLGCATYDPLYVEALASQTRAVPFEMKECEDFGLASQAMVDGPKRTMAGLGRANQLKDMSALLKRQEAVCTEIVTRGTLTTTAQTAVRQAFDRTWGAASQAVKP